MEKESFATILIGLYSDYTVSLVEREKSGGAHYDDMDFTFDKFMNWLANYRKLNEK